MNEHGNAHILHIQNTLFQMAVCVHKTTEDDYKMHTSSLLYYTSTESYQAAKNHSLHQKKIFIIYILSSYLDLL
jgi:hypothetical protein